MGGKNLSAKQVIDYLTEMGFENSDIMEAVKAVGPSLDAAAEYILNGCCRSCKEASTSSKSCTSNRKPQGKRASAASSIGQTRQSSILDHFGSNNRTKRSKISDLPSSSGSRSEVLPCHLEVNKSIFPSDTCNVETHLEPSPVCCSEDIGPDWEQRFKHLLKKHFGFPSLKSFQKEALAAWLAHQDCLVLAATGSVLEVIATRGLFLFPWIWATR